jgi:hypothetical protein
MSRTALMRLPRRAATVAVGLAVVAGGTMVAASPAFADTTVASAHATGTSSGVDLYVEADLQRDSSNRLYATGHDDEEHEYLRKHHIVVTLEQRTAAGTWVVVAQAEGTDYEGAQATTSATSAGGTFRACSAASVDSGAVVSVCTA